MKLQTKGLLAPKIDFEWVRECGEDDSAYFQRCKYVFSITPVARLQVFLGHLTHQSSLHTTPCLPGLLVPSRTPWAGSCNSKLDFFFFFLALHTNSFTCMPQFATPRSEFRFRKEKEKKKKFAFWHFLLKILFLISVIKCVRAGAPFQKNNK